MTLHRNFQQGQHVFVQLRNGEKFEDQFFEMRAKHLRFVHRGRIRTAAIRSVTILRRKS